MDDPIPEMGIDLAVTAKNVVRVCDAQGRPTLAILPWESYRKLLRDSIHAGPKPRGRPRKDRDVYPRHRKTGPQGGRPKVVGSHVLRELIRENSDFSAAGIAALFLGRTGIKVDHSTVHRYRSEAEKKHQSRSSEIGEIRPDRESSLVVTLRTD